MVQGECRPNYRPVSNQDKILASIEAVAMNTTDQHLCFAKLGERLGFVSELVIRRGFSSIYVENNSKELKPKVDAIRQRLKL